MWNHSWWLTNKKDLWDKSAPFIESFLGFGFLFHIRPNFGERSLSIRTRVLHVEIVITIDWYSGPYGFHRGRIEGKECVDGAYTRCIRELAWSIAPRMLTAPVRTQISYWPTNVTVCKRRQILVELIESRYEQHTSLMFSRIVHSSAVSPNTLSFEGMKVESCWIETSEGKDSCESEL